MCENYTRSKGICKKRMPYPYQHPYPNSYLQNVPMCRTSRSTARITSSAYHDNNTSSSSSKLSPASLNSARYRGINKADRYVPSKSTSALYEKVSGPVHWLWMPLTFSILRRLRIICSIPSSISRSTPCPIKNLYAKYVVYSKFDCYTTNKEK